MAGVCVWGGRARAGIPRREVSIVVADIGARVDVDARLPQRLAAVARLERRELLSSRAQRASEVLQRCHARVDGVGARPGAGHERRGRAHGSIDVGRAAVGQLWSEGSIVIQPLG